MFLSISLPLSRNLTPSLSYHIVRKRIAKVTDFLSFCPFGISIFPFLTIGISMYQKRILPYFIIPSTFSPQASSPLERYGQRNFNTLLPKFFFFFTERAGPYPQAQLYHGQLGISLTFPPPFFSYSPTGSTWLRHGVQFCQYQAYVLRLETYYGLRRR